MARIFTFDSPLGDALRFRQMDGQDGLSSLFHSTVNLISTNHAIWSDALLGKSVTITVELEHGAKRYLNAQVTGFRKTGEEQRYAQYQAELAPWLWYAIRAADCRIFQNMTAVQIAEQVLQKYGFPFEKKLAETYQPIGYYVQYNETDYQFLSRLFQQEGLYFYNPHADGVHTLVLVDYPGAHKPLPNHARIRFVSVDRKGMAGEECIIEREDGGSVKTGRYVTDDYHFKTPRAELQQIRNDPKTLTHGDCKIYNWGQGFTNGGHGAHPTKAELEALQNRHAFNEGTTTVRGMAPGYTFSLFQHLDAGLNIGYLVTGTAYHFSENPYSTGDACDYTNWNIRFTAQKSVEQSRAVKVTPWPHVGGPHTAVVLGPKGQEVLVEYVNGEVNRPIITGRVYNADQMPPWNLPANATQSDFLTRSTPGGGPDNANAIRFEGKKGDEELWLHAEKDPRNEVEHDESHWVGRDRRKTIDRDETVHIKRDRTETVNHTEIIAANDTISVGGNRTKSVAKHAKDRIGKNWPINVGMDRMESVGLGYNLHVGLIMATMVGVSQTTNAGKSISLSAGSQIEIVCGNSKIVMTPDAIYLDSKDIHIKAGNKVHIDGPDDVLLNSGGAKSAPAD